MSVLDLIPEEDDVFTTYQTIILMRKAQGATYEKILKEIPQIKSPKVLTTVFRWTLNGRKFEIGKTTGRPPLIGDVQLEIFRKKVEERCDENNAISLFEAVTLLKFEYGKIILERSWLTQLLKRNNIEIKTPESLEAARDKFCHSQILINFLYKFYLKYSSKW